MPNDPDCTNLLVIARSILTAIDGAAQAGGILVALEGVFMPTQYAPEAATKRPPKLPTETPSTPESPKPNDKNLFWLPTPMTVGGRGIGVGVVGRF